MLLIPLVTTDSGDSISSLLLPIVRYYRFVFNSTATTEIYTLTRDDGLPICKAC